MEPSSRFIRLALTIATIVSVTSPPEHALAGQHLEQHDTERPDVGALVDGLPRACSGLMYVAVPSRIAHPVAMTGEASSASRR